jgi:hypothetical protein
MCLKDVVEAVRLKRRSADEQVVQCTSKAVSVSTNIGTARVPGLSGSNVIGRTEHRAFVSHAAVNRSLTSDLGQSKIQHLDHSPVTLLRQHQIAWLDVAVDHAELMCVLELATG